MRDVHPPWPQHRARIGRPPEDWVALAEPGKDPAPIGIEQAPRREGSAGGEQTVRIIERLVDRRKRVSRPEKRDHAKLYVRRRGYAGRAHERSLKFKVESLRLSLSPELQA